MRLVFFGNNVVGARVLAWLREQGEDVTAVVFHDEDRRAHGAELADTAGDAVRIEASVVNAPESLERLRGLEPELGVCAFFGTILRGPLIHLFPRGIVNLHPAFLPYNRGAYPNVWSIVEHTPAGASLHLVDEGVDTGALFARRAVRVEPTDTGATLYAKLEEACFELFVESWSELRAGRLAPIPQETGGTYHRTMDVERIDAIDLDRQTTARELIDVIRARTFPPHRGAYYVEDGRRIFLRLELEAEEEKQ
jgi:methionyl-tRNA formyltransferase